MGTVEVLKIPAKRAAAATVTSVGFAQPSECEAKVGHGAANEYGMVSDPTDLFHTTKFNFTGMPNINCTLQGAG